MSEFLLDELGSADSFAKLYALICVFCSVFKCAVSYAVVCASDQKSLCVKFLFNAGKTVAVLAKYICFFELYVIKHDLAAAIHSKA